LFATRFGGGFAVHREIVLIRPSLQTFYELFTPSLYREAYSNIVDSFVAEAARGEQTH
jgi:hypothetical protein